MFAITVMSKIKKKIVSDDALILIEGNREGFSYKMYYTILTFHIKIRLNILLTFC